MTAEFEIVMTKTTVNEIHVPFSYFIYQLQKTMGKKLLKIYKHVQPFGHIVSQLSSSATVSRQEIKYSEMKKLQVYLLILCLIGMVSANTFSSEKYYDRDVVRQVANWLVQTVRNSDLALCNLSPPKRNSEIINSILGLPKNLNDAGRK